MFLGTGFSTRQARASHTSAWYKVYVRPHGITLNFLLVLHCFWHSVFVRKICRQLRGYSEFRQYFLHLGVFFQSPQGHLGDMGQSDDLVSLLFWEVVVDNSTYKLAVFGATIVVLVRILSSPNMRQQGLTHCN
jgi:hypothetical protein